MNTSFTKGGLDISRGESLHVCVCDDAEKI